jgi:WD40 repeat protein
MALSQFEALAWTPDGSRLAVAEFGGSRIHLIDVTTGKRVQTLDASTRGGSITRVAGEPLAFSPDGRRVACVVQQRIGRQGTVNVLDTESGRVVLSLPIPNFFVNRLRFSPDGHRLIRFMLVSEASGEPATRVWKSHVQVTTWDATPRPENSSAP